MVMLHDLIETSEHVSGVQVNARARGLQMNDHVLVVCWNGFRRELVMLCQCVAFALLWRRLFLEGGSNGRPIFDEIFEIETNLNTVTSEDSLEPNNPGFGTKKRQRGPHTFE